LFVKATATAAPPTRMVVNVHKKKRFAEVLALLGLREKNFLFIVSWKILLCK
jgi:hypothetical protein